MAMHQLPLAIFAAKHFRDAQIEADRLRAVDPDFCLLQPDPVSDPLARAHLQNVDMVFA